MRSRALISALAILLVLTPLAAPLMDHPSARAQEEGVPLPVASFGEHPRLLITRAYIDETLKPRVPGFIA